jgi:SAM-dependent methyltransferase
MLTRVHRKLFVREPRFASFLAPDALAINEARLKHLATLNLPIENKSVLEVGGGIGLLTGFFEERGCTVTSTDGRKQNVAEHKKRHPERRLARLNLEQPGAIDAMGKFDVVFCYGTLYHLANPEPPLEALSRISDMILLETVLTPGEDEAVPNVPELLFANQALKGTGSRPTRAWVLNRLKRFWGHGYMSVTQPAHPDFPLDFSVPKTTLNVRAIFVGSKKPLSNPVLSTEVPVRHSRV